MRRGAITFATCIVVSFPIAAGGDDDPVSRFDIVYGKGGDVDLKLDLYRPHAQRNRTPGMLVIHGGAWRKGRKEFMRPFAEQMARAGYVAATVQYRLCPEHQFPAQIEDVKCAVRWMRANADKYGIDGERIGAIGASAGGHLALMLGSCDSDDGLEGAGGHAGFSSEVQAVANYYGPFDLTLSDWNPRHGHLLVDFLGGTLAERRDTYRRASPAHYVDPNDAPVITFHGTKDPLVPFGQAIRVDRTLRHHGVASRLEALEDRGHGWWGPDLHRTQKLAIEFFDEHLKRRRGAATQAESKKREEPEAPGAAKSR